MLYLRLILVSLLLAACSTQAPLVTSPTDGQVIQIESFQSFNVTLSDNNYQNTTISFRGVDAIGGDVQCQNTSGSQATCTHVGATTTTPTTPTQTGYPNNYYPQQTGGYGNLQTCTYSPCTVAIIVTRNNETSVVTVQFRR